MLPYNGDASHARVSCLLVGSDDHIQNAVHLNCADDDQAILLATEFADGHDVELWQLDRRVGTFPKMPHHPRQHQIVNEQLAKRRLELQGRAF
jgi:hypothetical protein